MHVTRVYPKRDDLIPAPSPVTGSPEQPGTEHLVSVRAEVLSDAEHALGNLFQRIRHVARAAGDRLGPHSERMNANLQDLERLLELVFDYVSPVEVELRPTACSRIADSLAAQLRTHGATELATGKCPELRLLADGRVLSRSFQLLARTLANELACASSASIEIQHNEGLGQAEFVVHVVSRAASAVGGAEAADRPTCSASTQRLQPSQLSSPSKNRAASQVGGGSTSDMLRPSA